MFYRQRDRGERMKLENNEIEFGQRIPYLDDRFQELLRILKKLKQLPVDKVSFQDYVAITVVFQGVQYYLDVLASLSDDKEKKLICHKLVASLNISVYAILSEKNISCNHDTQNDRNSEWLCVYREYLQSLYNAFRHEYADSSKKFGIVYSLGVNLMQAETKMNVLFSEEYISDVPFTNKNNVFCSVFIPTDSNIDNIYTYLPKLTHEVSHGFKYSETEDRNKFVLGYLLDALCRKMIRELFFQVSGNQYSRFIGDGEDKLAKAIKDVLWDEITEGYPELLEYGHLDEIPSAILSIFFVDSEDVEELHGFFKESVTKYDVVRQSFINLTKVSSMEWYLSGLTDEIIYSDTQKILSMISDIFVYEDMDKIREKYKDIEFEDSNLLNIANYLITNRNGLKEPFVTLEALSFAFDELILDIVYKLRCEIIERKDIYVETACLDRMLYSLSNLNNKFERDYNDCIEMIMENNQQAARQVADEVMTIRTNVEKLNYIFHLPGEIIIKHTVYEKNLAEKIYRKVKECINFEQSSKTNIVYSTREIHNNLIRLGFLKEEHSADQFVSNYMKIFNNWNKERVYAFLNQTLNVYREIFADLSMCAIFNLNSKGYFRYITQQFRYTRSSVESISRNQARERIWTVMCVLENDGNGCQFAEEIQDREEFWNPSWDNIFWGFKERNISSLNSLEDKKHYIDVYKDRIKHKSWVKKFSNDATIKLIGEYYNTNSMDEILRGNHEQSEKEYFKNKLLDISRKREKLREEKPEMNPIEVMLEDLIT